MKKDTSKDIFDQFYSAEQKPVRIRLKNGTILEGKFIGFYRGDTESGEPYIFRWHFLDKKLNMFDYDKSINPEQGTFINQADIASVEFA